MPEQVEITRIHLTGFRSLKEVTFVPGRVTAIVGANGSGKSNLLSFLRMVSLLRTQSLRLFVGLAGGAHTLLHYGPGTTKEIQIRLEFETPSEGGAYEARLGYAARDTLVFLDESVGIRQRRSSAFTMHSLGAGHPESLLADPPQGRGASVARLVGSWLARINFFHFHDTSPTSPLRQNARVSEDGYVRSYGNNLAAVLYRLQQSEQDDDVAAWKRIRSALRQVAPFVKSLEPQVIEESDGRFVRLTWVDERDHPFDIHDFSDGTLRALALITTLSQPAARLPAFLSIDEPELGLHPAAINLLTAMVRSVAPRCQVLLATQSATLLDSLRPEEVVVAERRRGESVFTRQDPEGLAQWLQEYSLSELFDKNVLGGRP